ncbi:helix-turn-helix domain-containing protein [Pseudonocardia sp. DLS-67]
MSGERAEDLPRLLAGDLSALSQDELVDAARRVEATRDETLQWSGRLLAALHDTHQLSWPAIARLTGIPQSTAHRRAQPYLTAGPDEGARS